MRRRRSLASAERAPETQRLEDLLAGNARLEAQVAALATRLRKRDEQRRALLHIMADLNALNKRLSDQRKAMLHILRDYEHDQWRLARQTERLDNTRRALLHILQDSHASNIRLANSRKAMIHIMDDLRQTTAEMQRREQELREKQEQLVQAGKLATLGELTTGVAHELNNPLNNIGLFVGNVIDELELGVLDKERTLRGLRSTMQQVRKATEIISHLRTFGRAAPVAREPVAVNDVLERALSLLREQLRLRQIRVALVLCPERPVVLGNPIQLEQVFVNLLSNARDAVSQATERAIHVACRARTDAVELSVRDTGRGIPEGLEHRIFDPFFTTKEVGAGTGLGLSITYGIIKEHHGTIRVANHPEGGAVFTVELPRGLRDAPSESIA